MRPIPEHLVPSAVSITQSRPWAHGAPVSIGESCSLGIASIEKPDYGDPVRLEKGDVPVFWACGVTTQAAAVASGGELVLTHAPASMFITDLPVPEPA